MKKYKPTSPVPFWMDEHRAEFSKIAKKVPKNELEELKEVCINNLVEMIKS